MEDSFDIYWGRTIHFATSPHLWSHYKGLMQFAWGNWFSFQLTQEIKETQDHATPYNNISYYAMTAFIGRTRWPFLGLDAVSRWDSFPSVWWGNRVALGQTFPNRWLSFHSDLLNPFHQEVIQLSMTASWSHSTSSRPVQCGFSSKGSPPPQTSGKMWDNWPY